MSAKDIREMIALKYVSVAEDKYTGEILSFEKELD